MTMHARSTSALPAIAILLWLAPASIASAQDVMELDFAFKNGRALGGAPAVRTEEHDVQAQHHETRDEKGRVEVKKRHVPRRRGQQR
jgi:hypothetical protein